MTYRKKFEELIKQYEEASSQFIEVWKAHWKNEFGGGETINPEITITTSRLNLTTSQLRDFETFYNSKRTLGKIKGEKITPDSEC